MTDWTADHPLRQTHAHMSELSAYLQVVFGAPQGQGWHALSELFAPGSAVLDEQIAIAQNRLRTRAVNVVASALLQSYQWPLIAVAVAGYLLDRRVPELGASNIRIHLDAQGDADGIAFLDGSFSALRGDAAAAHPDARLVADRAALREILRRGIENHLEPLIAHLCMHLGCRPRGLWLNVADRLASTVGWLMQSRDKQAGMAEIAPEVEALVRAPGSPLQNRQIGVFAVQYQEQRQFYVTRATCCYWYKTAGGEYCSTCPHRTPESRDELLLASMAKMGA